MPAKNTKKAGTKKTAGAAMKKTTRKKSAPSDATKKARLKAEFDLIKKARHFRNLGHKRIGMLFSGGPAPGANAVISTAAIQFLNAHYEVIGFYKGYQYLEKFDREAPKKFREDEHYKSLNYDDVTKIRQLGGSILRTARANPSKKGDLEIKRPRDLANPKLARRLYNVMDALEFVGIGALISIGGDDTLKTAYYLHLLGVPVVHIPKTIDNDYFGIPWTFGYFTAIEQARQDIKTYNSEVRTTECYFVLELMGRKAGWYTIGAGIAGEAVRMIGPEEISGQLDLKKLTGELVDLVQKREEIGKRYGVILLSEGLVDKLPEEMKPQTVDPFGNIVFREAKIGDLVGKAMEKEYRRRKGHGLLVKTEKIGYTTRCVEPSAFDVLLGSQLGMGAYKFVKEEAFGSMVSVGDNLEIKKVPFGQLIDQETFKTALRYVPLDGDFYKLAKSLEFRAVNSDLDSD